MSFLRKFTGHYVFMLFGCFLLLGILFQCKQDRKQAKIKQSNNKNILVDTTDVLIKQPEGMTAPNGMVWIPGGIIVQGAVTHDEMAMAHEKPAIKVILDGFFMDITEVTNAQFKKFVDATGYETVAERTIDWEEMKKQLPAGTPKPHDSIMQPGSLTFKKTKAPVANLYDFSQWWNWTIGANWKHPDGPKSSIEGKMNDPVVHIAFEDALSFCEWAGRRLPTEAEWERAAKGKNANATFFWGDDETKLAQMANTWNGQFPVSNTKIDGFESRSPVKSFSKNDFGLYDMAGNVWEWTSDWYNTNYYREISAAGMTIANPNGAKAPYNERNSFAREKVMKGGSFLCNASYCASYRISSRMATSLDSSLEHLGFRTVVSVAMIETSEEK